MEYRVEELKGFQVIGFSKEFSEDHSYQEIPMFWEEVYQKYGTHPTLGKAIQTFKIGEYGVCLDEICQDGKFTYMIAGQYEGETVPEGLCVFEFPKMTWAKFTCVGTLPNALQEINTKIFTEWLPQNKIYELAKRYSIEWYSDAEDTQSNEYVSEIWIPVKRK